jgi:hypothetical protein
MKKIAFMFLLLFVFVAPVFAGENQNTNQTEKQIIVAFQDANACKDSCRNLFDICQRICQGRTNDSFCVSDCMDSYQWCCKNCDRDYPNK